MALRIRLRRMGRKKAPHYRIVVAERSMPRDGRFVARLGHYNPRTDPATVVVDREETITWIARGATPTDTVRSLLKRAGVFSAEPVTEDGDDPSEAAPEAPGGANAETGDESAAGAPAEPAA